MSPASEWGWVRRIKPETDWRRCRRNAAGPCLAKCAGVSATVRSGPADAHPLPVPCDCRARPAGQWLAAQPGDRL